MKNTKWTVQYEDRTHVYQDEYLDEITAKEYHEERIAEGFQNVIYFQNQ